MTRSGTGGLTPSLPPEDDPESLVPVEARARPFGRYQLRYEIAAGGMATVYLGRALGPAGFDRAVAVKRIHPHLAKKKDFVDMFLDEARLCARITHPNVCTVFDFGQVEGTYFMAMEYLVGQPFTRVLRAVAKKPFLARTERWRAFAASMLADACEGLHAAHELRDDVGQPLGVVHRDVSPHNLFVTYEGAVKVMDFGVALSEGRLHQTVAGGLKGKLAYMAPEQIQRANVDRRADVWALGVCLWELIALKRLFGGGKRSEGELLDSVMNAEIPPPSRVMPDTPPELDAIVMRALERDVERRYPTARALGRDLAAYVARTGIPAGLPEREMLLTELFADERKQKLVLVQDLMTRTSGSVESDLQGATYVSGEAPRPPIPQLAIGGGAPALGDAPPPLELAASFKAPPPEEKAPSAGRDPLVVFMTTLAAFGIVVGGALVFVGGDPRVLVALVSGEEPTTVTELDAGAMETGPGTLVVTSSAGVAEVWIGDRRRGTTPLTLELPSGLCSVELRPPGGEPQRATVIIHAGRTETLAF